MGTTTAASPKSNILILNTWYRVNVPVITNASGLEDRLFKFQFGNETEVYQSCSITWRNEHYVFGGDLKYGD